MGKSKILGGGAGKPLNASKSLEYAGESIPSNYFVTKKEGIEYEQRLTMASNLMSDTPFIRIGDGSLVIHAYWASAPANYAKALTAYKNGVSISSVNDTQSYSYRSNPTLIHLPSSKKILFTHTNYDKSYVCVSVFSYTDDGELTLEQSDLQTSATGMTRRFFAAGEYGSNFFYGISRTSNYSDSKNYLEKWEITTSGLNLISQTEISDYASANAPVYEKQFDRIFARGTACLIVNPNDASTITISGTVTNATSIFDNLVDSACFRGRYGSDVINKKIYVSTRAELLLSLDIQTGTVEAITITPVSMSASTSERVLGIIQSPYDPNLLYGIYGSDFVIIDLSEKTIAELGSVYSSTDYQSANTSVPILYKGRFDYYLIRYSTSSYYVYKASYSIPHLELPEDPVLYGISVGSIKQYEQGYVYTTDQLSTQAITTYGVAEPVADAIIDGSIDELKAEVQKGVTDGTL